MGIGMGVGDHTVVLGDRNLGVHGAALRRSAGTDPERVADNRRVVGRRDR